MTRGRRVWWTFASFKSSPSLATSGYGSEHSPRDHEEISSLTLTRDCPAQEMKGDGALRDTVVTNPVPPPAFPFVLAGDHLPLHSLHFSPEWV